jgi:hypothetical protein
LCEGWKLLLRISSARHIVSIDSNHQVDIQVASADTILVHNGAASTMAGNVTLVW